MVQINVKASKSYDVVIGQHVLETISCPSKKALLITQPGAAAKHSETLEKTLLEKTIVKTFQVPDGESAKSMETLEELYSFALENNFDKADSVYAVGGGAVGDLAGFFASTYKRGISLFHVPTTLIAQCDSSIGGKTAINVDKTKNAVGTIYQPDGVYCDVSTLQTLDEENMRNGLAEVIKYGLIFDEKFFDDLGQSLNPILKKNPDVLEKIVSKSVSFKSNTVEKDEFDQGERLKLNYGHTIGHAIESLTRAKHGFAISVGMAGAGSISREKGLLSQKELDRQNQLLEKAGLPLTSKANSEEVLEKMRNDKKRFGKIRMVLLEGIGKCRVEVVEEKEILNALGVVLQ